jgi:hypothetical protein
MQNHRKPILAVLAAQGTTKTSIARQLGMGEATVYPDPGSYETVMGSIRRICSKTHSN